MESKEQRDELFVGMDYHSGSVQVCVMDASGAVRMNRRLVNDVFEIVQAVLPLGQVRRIAIEACSGVADFCEELWRLSRWTIQQGHPGIVRRMKQSRDKTDRGDARLLAELCRADFVPQVWLAPAYIRDLRSLTRMREAYVEDGRRAKTRTRAVLRENRIQAPSGMRPWTRAWRAWVRSLDVRELVRNHLSRLLRDVDDAARKVREVSCELAEITTDDPMVQRLLEQTGVGPVTAWTMRAEIGRFDRFATGKQLARFCGLTPRNVSSGERVADAGLIKAGSPSLKRVLILAAHRLRNRVDRWRELGDRLEAKGKHRCVAIAAIANRWVRRLHHHLKQVPASLPGELPCGQ